jgi:hypothetical protein|tara:strand:- start:41 stop:226 length:186 start_codon:yes stop_codon:yes gene_type:complete
MQFHKNSSIGKSNNIFKGIIKIFFVFLILFIGIILVDKIEFPSPNKKIEKFISNDDLKIIK